MQQALRDDATVEESFFLNLSNLGGASPLDSLVWEVMSQIALLLVVVLASSIAIWRDQPG